MQEDHVHTDRMVDPIKAGTTTTDLATISSLGTTTTRATRANTNTSGATTEITTRGTSRGATSMHHSQTSTSETKGQISTNQQVQDLGIRQNRTITNTVQSSHGNDNKQLKICALNVCGLTSKIMNGVFID